MAKIEGIIPFLLKWEAGVERRPEECLEALFERARKRGVANDPADRGGATMAGVTLSTYQDWCARHGRMKPKAAALKGIAFKDWLSVLKEGYWDRWRADVIRNQSVAVMCVDWVWCSGRHGITNVQRILGVSADGLAGPKTLEALNASDQRALFKEIYDGRVRYLNNIAAYNPTQRRFLKGWLNRVNDIRFEE